MWIAFTVTIRVATCVRIIISGFTKAYDVREYVYYSYSCIALLRKIMGRYCTYIFTELPCLPIPLRGGSAVIVLQQLNKELYCTLLPTHYQGKRSKELSSVCIILYLTLCFTTVKYCVRI